MNLSDKDIIWHPFTAQKDAPQPIHIERGEGSWIYASDGRKFIDAVSSWWVNIHGHAQPYIAKRIAEQALKLEHVIFAGFTHTPAIELARNLLEILPGKFSKVFYSDNGSTAVEVALKMAVQYWHNKGEKRTKIVAFQNAYHGDTFGAMSAGDRSTFTAAFDSLLFDVIHIPVPRTDNINVCKQILGEVCARRDVAAFIFEPLVQGTAGMQMHSEEHLDELIKIAKKKNIICIADEVMTGFGRTGKLFACDYLDEEPEIICLSKGITGGFMPLGVTVCNEKIYEAFYSSDKTKTFYHGHSYTANPLACAAAVASLELLMQEKCFKQIDMICAKHAAFYEEIKNETFVKEVRRCGTILAVEFNTPGDSSYFNSMRNTIYDACLEKGVLLRPLGNIIYCMPPYCITEEELEQVYGAMRYAGRVVSGF
jgi:adenosylmethionine---8-amino-7-oxononanoate aminotransferase